MIQGPSNTVSGNIIGLQSDGLTPLPNRHGVEILNGDLKVDTQLMKKDGVAITSVKEIQLEKKNVN